MCGIVGIWHRDGAPVDGAILEAMCRAIAHRGPDDQGIQAGPGIGLGNRRLKVIDLSPAGHQPMVSENGALWLTFNGEIYNFEEIRKELLARGHRFHSRTDTEVLLRAYAEYGDACLDRLNGMFAFALWDGHRRRLLLTRDRLGIKPLYYAQVGNALVFGSEIKGLLASGLVPRDVDPAAIHHLLGSLTIPAPLTILKDVRALLPGHTLIADERGVRTAPYWKLPFGATPEPASEREWTERLRALLEDAVRLQQVGDVPIGAFLSGGVDSTGVVGLMTRLTGRPVRTFCVGCEEDRAAHDERRYARLAAERFGAEHVELVVGAADLASHLARIVWFMDQPAGRALESYFVAQAACSRVTVALSGLGGDELFAGYRLESILGWADRLAPLYRLPQIPSLVRSLAARWPTAPTRWRLTLVDRLLSASSFPERYAALHFPFAEAERRSLYTPAFGAAVGEASSLDLVGRLTAETGGWDGANRLGYLNAQLYLANDLLLHTDTMSMAHSLEVRVPLLDHRLVELAARVPHDLKVRRGMTKYLLRRALADLLPPETVSRPKTGFSLPMARYLRHQLRPLVESTLADAVVARRGYFRPAAVRAIRDHFFQQRDVVWAEHLQLWLLVVLELWHRLYVDRTAPTPPGIGEQIW
ncbi:MAG: asparagine synthase (glutamine-hydrolyzing) [Chloroflexi bacterium]|nr:asparagine synthase (glutamine-hydrolyzing) [Chloroflexota bacterium]